MNLNDSIGRSISIIKSIAEDPSIKDNSKCANLLKNITESLISLDKFSKERGHDPQAIDTKTISVLKKLERQVGINHVQLGADKAASIQVKLKEAQGLFAPPSLTLEKERPKTPSVDMNLAFMCDLDAPDHNGAIASAVINGLRSKVPFVTTRSLLLGVNINEKVKTLNSLNIERLILENAAGWTIFQENSEHGEEFLVFVPKPTAGEKEAAELLKSLDFKGDGTLKKITARQALTPPIAKAQIDSFFNLFTDSPTKSKLIYIGGHGGVGSPAGLSKENYEKYLQFMKKQNCLGMSVCSCYSGGQSTLIHTKQAKAEYLAKENTYYRGSPEVQALKFPVIMRSIGDFPTFSGQEAEADFSAYFSELSQYLESGSGETIPALLDAVNRAEKGKNKTVVNLSQVFFPSDEDSPAGFRPIGEGNESYSLTYNRLQGERILMKQNASDAKGIVCENKQLLELHPLLVNCPMVFQGKNPILLSMIPGNAQHYIEKIQLAEGDIKSFLGEVADFYITNTIGVNKAFYIGELKDEVGQKTQQVTVFLKEGGFSCVFSQNDTYYYWDGTADKWGFPRPISALQYALTLDSILENTKPDVEAVRSQTGGQQDQKQFENSLKKIKEISTLRETFSEAKVQGMSKVELDLLIGKFNSLEEKESLVFHLLKCKRTDLALDMIKSQKLSVDMKAVDGCPLIINAALAGEWEFVDFLLENQAKLNVSNPMTGDTLLHIAASKNNPELILKLFENNVDIEAKNLRGSTPLFGVLIHHDMAVFNLFKDKGANLNVVTKKGNTILSAASHFYPPEVYKKYLNVGIDPNLGDPPPLFWAIVKNDPEAIAKLLDQGADLYQQPLKVQGANLNQQQPSKFNAPIFEAMLRCPPETVIKLFNHKNFDPNFSDNDGVTPLIVALRLANIDYVKILLEKGAVFPPVIQEALFNQGYARMQSDGNFTVLELILKESNDPEFEQLIFYHLADNNPELIKKWIERGLIKNPQNLLDAACSLAYVNFKEKRWAVEALVHKGVDLNKNNGHYFGQIIEFGDFDLIKLAVEKGAKITPESLNKSLKIENEVDQQKIFKWLVEQGGDVNFGRPSPFVQAINSGKLELVDICLEHHADVKSGEDGELSPLAAAAKAIVGSKDPQGLIYKKLVKDYAVDQNRLGCSENYSTPFAMLVETGNIELIEWCLANGAKAKLPYAWEKATPLQAAGRLKNDRDGVIFKRLLDEGAEINQKGINQNPPIIAVLGSGRLDLAKFCFDNGTVLNEERLQINALIASVSSGNVEIIKFLKNRGIPFTSDIIDKNQLLTRGYIAGGKSMFDGLYDQSVSPFVDNWAIGFPFWNKVIKNNDLETFTKMEKFKELIVQNLETIQSIAASEGKIEFFEELEKMGFAIDFHSLLLINSFDVVDRENIAALQYFIGKISDPTKIESSANTVFNKAISLEKKLVVQELISMGIDVNIPIGYGEYPLFLAIEKRNLELIQLIIDAGADLTLKSKSPFSDGQTALQVARKSGNPTILAMITEALAKQATS